MSRLVFAREPQSVPFDLDGQLSGWRPASAYGDPEHDMATRYVGHAFAGAAGYVADLDRQLVGRDAISALAIVTPDYGAPGVACIVARGDAGASPDRFYGYEFGLDVHADDIGLYHSYQDSTGAEHYQEIATVGRPPDGAVLIFAWCREGERLCAFVNGDQVGDVALAGDGPVITLDVPMTVGCRAMTTGYERHFRGVLQYVEVHEQAVTAASERHRYQRLWTLPAQYGGIAESLLLPLPGRNYRAVRRAALGTVTGACAADIARAESGMSPTTAYGPALQRWEHAAGLRPPPTANIADRQAATTAALRGPGGFSVPALQAYAAELMGVDAGDVAIVEGSNQLELPCAGDGPIPGPWRVTGVGHAYSDADGLYLRARAGDDLSFLGYNQHGIQLAVGIPHGPGSTSNAFVATIDDLVGSSENAWAGIILRTHTEALWLAVFAQPDGKKRLSWRRAGIDSLSPWAELATLVGDLELAVEYDDGTWVTRVGMSRIALPDAPVEWIGVALGSDGPLADDLSCSVTSANLLCGDAPVHWQWTAVCESPRFWRDEHIALLNRRSRASAQAFISRAPALCCGDPRAQIGRTPLASTTEARLLPERGDEVYRVVGMRPSYLFTYEGTAIRERVAGIEVLAANPGVMAATSGPDGRPALAYDPMSLHYTTDMDLIPFAGGGFAIAMVCRLGDTAGRVLTYWHPSQRVGIYLDCLPSGHLRLTAGSPDAQTVCQLHFDDQASAWTCIVVAIQRYAGRWRATLATPTASHANEFDGGEFTPVVKFIINRWATDFGTAMACRWLGVFEDDQVGEYDIDRWDDFAALIARASRAP